MGLDLDNATGGPAVEGAVRQRSLPGLDGDPRCQIRPSLKWHLATWVLQN
jgi:hypothetical protein